MAGAGKIRAGRCHCGSVRFEVSLSDGLRSIRRCTCSYCRMPGAKLTIVPTRQMVCLSNFASHNQTGSKPPAPVAGPRPPSN